MNAYSEKITISGSSIFVSHTEVTRNLEYTHHKFLFLFRILDFIKTNAKRLFHPMTPHISACVKERRTGKPIHHEALTQHGPMLARRLRHRPNPKPAPGHILCLVGGSHAWKT